MNSSNTNYNSSISKCVLGNLKSKKNYIKNNGKLILNEESIDKIKNQSMFPFFHFVKNIQKKNMTAENSPGHSRIKDILSKDINTNHKNNNDKISFQNVKQTLLKNVINKNYKNKATNLKLAYATRKNSKNKGGYKNIMSEYKLN